MATVATVKDGNWTDPTVWDSGSVPGAADEPHISHVVVDDRGNDTTKYTAHWTIEPGGELLVPYGADTVLKAGEGWKLVGKSGGKWRFVSDTLIDSSHEYLIEIDQGSAERVVLDFEDGFEFDIRSNPAWYGGSRKFPLHQNWSSGDTLYVTGDATDWKAGGKIWLPRNNTAGGTEARIYTIASVGIFDGVKTPIQVTVSDPFFEHIANRGSVTSEVLLLNRNVFIGDIDLWDNLQIGLSWTRRLTTSLPASAANKLGGCLPGWIRFAKNGEKIQLKDSCVIFPRYFVFFPGNIINFEGDVIGGDWFVRNGGIIENFLGGIHSCTTAVTYGGVIKEFVGDIACCNSIVPTGGCIENFSGIIKNCTQVVTQGGEIVNFTGDILSCTHLLVYRGEIINFSGKLDGTSNILYGGIIDNFEGNFSSSAILKSFHTSRVNLINSSVDGVLYKEFNAKLAVGEIISLKHGDTEYQEPQSGEEIVYQLLPNSYCNSSIPIDLWLRYGKNCLKSGQHTLTFRIYPVGWSADLTEDDFEFWVEYYSSDTDYSRSRVNAVHTSPNGAWRDIAVSFDHKHDGEVRFNLSLKKYESGAYVLVDPLPKEWI